MKAHSFVHITTHPPRLLTTRLVLLLMLLSLFLVARIPSNRPLQQTPALMYQTSGLAVPQTPIKPATWIYSREGGSRISGPITVIFPSGFTNQSGANAYANQMVRDSGISKPTNVLPSTEFNLGIWPANDQVQYQKPIEIRLVINTAQVPADQWKNLVMMMYNPERKTWEPQPSRFDDATDQLITQVQHFTPMAKDFPDWGGRTFFCVLNRGETSTAVAATPTVRQTANLRAGPGTNYAISGRVVKGQSLQLVGKSMDGRWYQLQSGEWIAAFLVADAPDLPTVR